MRIERIVLTIFCSLVCCMLVAQTASISKINIEWDERNDEKVLPMNNSFKLHDGNLLVFSRQIAATNGGLISIGGGKQFALSIVDKERNILKTASYKPGSLCNSCNAGILLKLGDKYFVSMIPDADQGGIMMYEVNTTTLEIKQTEKNLENFEDGISRNIFSLTKEKSGFHLRGAIVKEKSELFHLILRLYDSNFNKVVDQDIELPFKRTDLLSWDIDKEGNVYVLVGLYVKGRNDKGKKVKEWIKKLYVTSPKDSKIEVVDIEKSEEKWLADVEIMDRKEGSGIIFCGQYYDEESFDEKLGRTTINTVVERQGDPTAGKVMMSYERSSGFSERVYTPFKKSVLKPSFIEKEREKKSKKKKTESLVGLPNLLVNEIAYLKNGNIVECSEAFIDHTVGGHGTAKQNNFQYLGKLVITVFTPEGEVVWMKSIDRIHRVKDWFIPSSKMFLQQNYIGVVFLDGKSSYVYLYDMETGKRKKKSLNKKGEKSNLIVEPEMTKRIDDQTVLIYRSKGKKSEFGRIIFE